MILFVPLLLLAVGVALVLVGVGLAVGAAGVACVALLVGLGVVGSSILLGVWRGRISVGVRALHYQVVTLLGLLSGTAVGLGARGWNSPLSLVDTLWADALVGMLAGVILAFLADQTWRWIRRRLAIGSRTLEDAG